MKIIPFDYCNECKRDTHLIVTSVTEESIYATCPRCSAKCDLIYDEWAVKQAKARNIERIVWYTRKVAELGAVHPFKRNQYRSQRLLAYKFSLNERLKEARK